ncbi:MAG: bifunctional phosphopantothenoylcysteine decarboxylase/phosphopantothenate--cysteine ligase CoaBC [Halobacteriota archaeon]
MRHLEGKTVVVGVTGSIAAVEVIKLVRALRRSGADVHAVMSHAACHIIHPHALEYATQNPVITKITGMVEHVKFCGIGGCANALLVAPCTANTISKIANGIDDTPVTTFAITAIGSGTPVLVAPAMHEAMFNHPIISQNLAKLRELAHIVEPCIEEDRAKIAESEEIVGAVERVLSKKDLVGKRILVTSGATVESIDPVRILTNRSSGRTGRAIAFEAYRRGAQVTIVHNYDVKGLSQIKIESAGDMIDVVLEELAKGYDIFVNSAAISDFTVNRAPTKIKSGNDAILELRTVPKLTKLVQERHPNLFIVCFKAETNTTNDELIRCAQSIDVDIVVANDVTSGGMGTEDNEIFIINQDVERYCGKKELLAVKIVDAIVKALNK